MDLGEARHAFVTGGASGIGLAIACALADRGLCVTIADVNEENLAAAAAPEVRDFGRQLLDVRDRQGWLAAKAQAERRFGPVDILVNNAGIATDGKAFIDMAPESFDRIVAINLTGIYNGIWALGGDMAARRRGHIVITSSEVGLVTCYPGIGAYSAAKFGVTALGEILRAEMAAHDVGVSVLFPGHIKTNLSANTRRLGGDVRPDPGHVPGCEVTPSRVGQMVAEGIERNAAYIFTHASIWPAVETRMEALREAFDYRRTGG